MTPLMLAMFDSAYSHSYLMLGTVACYVVAKFAELWDVVIFNFTFNIISGHTLKHLIAGVGLFFLPRMIEVRRINKQSIL